MSIEKLLQAIEEGNEYYDDISLPGVDINVAWVGEAFSEIPRSELLRMAGHKAHMIFESGREDFLISMAEDLQEELRACDLVNQEARRSTDQLIAEMGWEETVDASEIFESYRIYIRSKLTSDYVRSQLAHQVQRWLSRHLGYV